MHKLIRSAADRLTRALVPSARAGACGTDFGEVVYLRCGCVDKREWRRRCVINCFGQLICGECERTNVACS